MLGIMRFYIIFNENDILEKFFIVWFFCSCLFLSSF